MNTTSEAKRARRARAYLPRAVGIDQHVSSALDRYVRRGTSPGGFLEAVIANDLRATMQRAYRSTLRAQCDIVCEYVAKHVPEPARGSWDAIAAWREAHRDLAEIERGGPLTR